MTLTYELTKWPATKTSHTIGVPVILKNTLSTNGPVAITGGLQADYTLKDGDRKSSLAPFSSFADLRSGQRRLTVGQGVQILITNTDTGLITVSRPQIMKMIWELDEFVDDEMAMQLALGTLGLTYSTVTSGTPDSSILAALLQGQARAW